MKKFLKKTLITSMATGILLQAGSAFAKEDVYDYLLDPMPQWYGERFTRGHIDVKKMMKKGYTRLEALEIQNQMKDILENNSLYMELEEKGETYDLVKKKNVIILEALNQAIKSVKSGYHESGFKPEQLKKNEFYVAFDMDETLMVQWYKTGLKGDKYYDFKVDTLDSILRSKLISPDYVSFTPGWEKAILDISKIPGNKGIIFFTAKEDKAANAIMDKLKINNQPARSFLKGFFTRNHLIRETSPVKLSKDLRMIDESLKHIILIDDNPTRILNKQFDNLREFPKYNPDEYLTAKNENKDQFTINYFEKLMPVIVEEIRESSEYSKNNNISFTEAYLPYSMSSSAVILMLIKQGYTLKEANDLIRKKHNMFEPDFFFYEDK